MKWHQVIMFLAGYEKFVLSIYLDHHTSIEGSIVIFSLPNSSYSSLTLVTLISLATLVKPAGSGSLDSWYKMLTFNQNDRGGKTERKHKFELPTNHIAQKWSKNLQTSLPIGQEPDLPGWSHLIRELIRIWSDLIRSWSHLNGNLIKGDRN